MCGRSSRTVHNYIVDSQRSLGLRVRRERGEDRVVRFVLDAGTAAATIEQLGQALAHEMLRRVFPVAGTQFDRRPPANPQLIVSVRGTYVYDEVQPARAAAMAPGGVCAPTPRDPVWLPGQGRARRVADRHRRSRPCARLPRRVSVPAGGHGPRGRCRGSSHARARGLVSAVLGLPPLLPEPPATDARVRLARQGTPLRWRAPGEASVDAACGRSMTRT